MINTVRKHYIKDEQGKTHIIDFFCTIEDGKTFVEVDNAIHHLKVFYREERTWDDHLGNTPCGYFCNVPINGKIRRVYMFG